MELQDKSDRWSTTRAKCKGIHNDPQGRSIKLVVRWTTQSGFNCEIKIKICGTILLYSEKRWFIIVGSRLEKAQSSHNKEQDPFTSN